MNNITLKNGKAIMSSEAFQELKNKGLIVYSGTEPMFLYKGYANKIIIASEGKAE